MIRSAYLGLVGVVVLVGAPHSFDATAAAARPASVEPQQPAGKSSSHPVSPNLTAAPRPAPPASEEELWLVPRERRSPPPRAAADFVAAVRLLRDAKAAQALPAFTSPALKGTPLEHYGRYHAGLAYLNMGRPEDARAAFAQVRAAKPAGYLAEAAALREAEAATAASDFAGAARLYEPLARAGTGTPDAVLLALAQAHEKAGNADKAAEIYRRLYYEFPLSDLGAVAATALGPKGVEWLRESSDRYKLELRRAEQLFAARRYPAAREAFDLIGQVAAGDDRELAALRVAECDHYLGRFQQARDGLEPFLEKASRKAEARFFHLTATRGLGRFDEYEERARALVRDFPDSSWAQETLNNLGTHFILRDDDGEAAKVFGELYEAFPKGRHAPRAAWKAGWWAYKNGRHAEAARLFEHAAGAFPRSDYRPSYLYWAARAREQAGDRAGATSVYRIVHADYQQSYYGRLTGTRLERLGVPLKADAQTRPRAGTRGTAEKAAAVVPAADEDREDDDAPEEGAAAAADVPPPPNADLITYLIGLEQYDLARNEVLYAQRTWGNGPLLDATLAWTYHKENDLRRGIIYMKRAYPQFLSAHGAALPDDLLRVIFPIDYWPLINKYSRQHGLDPFLVAALINQESSFIPDAKSRANAVGLMQVLPSTGRRLARQQRLRFTAASLTRPEFNIRLGTAFFADLSRRLGGVHLALASYNAGAHRVSLWRAERPGLERDEFIDDIPFPETQNYVKKILGSAEDYRALYKDYRAQSKNDDAAGTGPSAKGTSGTKAPAAKASAARASAGKAPAAKAQGAKATGKKAPAGRKAPAGKTSTRKAPAGKTR